MFPLKATLTAALVFVALTDVAMAQFIEMLGDRLDSGGATGPMEVAGAGWEQFSNVKEMAAIVANLLIVLALASLFAFHPTRLKNRRKLKDLVIPRLFALYAIIGMSAGFLVINHGYIIGFVFFGIGALMRFRSSMDNDSDTVEVILVTVLGLTVGLGLPMVAIFIALIGWVVVWIGGRTTGYELALKGQSIEEVKQGLADVEKILAEIDGRMIRSHLTSTKLSMEILMVVRSQIREGDLAQLIRAGVGDELAFKLSS
ncbi:MAG: hypothetical protein L3J37_03270 [Rhodobacteraceae bacterium]|nr:hypothetical protein [Paracoccaceae bacterium]